MLRLARSNAVPSSAGSDREGANLPFHDASQIDLDGLNRLLAAIYEGPLESPPWQSVLKLLKETLNAAHVTLMLRPPSQESTGIMVHTGTVTAQGMEAYDSHFFAMDPFVGLPEGEVFIAEDMIGKRWLQTAIYQEYLKPLDIRHLLGADIYTKEGIECRFRVTRSHDAPPFSDDDKALCRFLLPHLKRSIQLHARLDFLECERQLFSGTINRMLLGMISFTQNGAILEMNQEARRILAEKDGIWLSGNSIVLESNQECRELQKTIRQALSGTVTKDGPTLVEAMSVTRPSGRAKLGVVVRAIPLGQWSESKQRPVAVLYIRDPESNGAQASQEVVRRLFGLTRMEAALALCLAEGLTLDEAADKLNVRKNTARTHLRSIFCKTGVTRQTMLVRMLLNSVISLG